MLANIFGPDLGFVVLIILVVLVGGSQLPKIARNVGTAGKEFRKAQSEAEEEAEKERQAKAAKEAAQTPTAIAPPPVPVPPVASVPQAPSVAGPAPDTAEGSAITLTPAQLDALLKAREQQVRSEGPSAN